MIKLYFGSTPCILSTTLILAFGVFFGLVTARRAGVTNWGTLVLIVFLAGLTMSMLSGMKDGLSTPGAVMPMNHWVTITLFILGGLAIIVAIITLFIRKQDFWQISFYIMSGIIIAKIIMTEVFRIAAYFNNIE